MLSLEQCRKIEPSLSELTDDEQKKIVDELYSFAGLALDSYMKKAVPKIPVGISELH